MSLLFNDQRLAHGVFTVLSTLETASLDAVLIGNKIWDSLAYPTTKQSPLLVCIQPANKQPTGGDNRIPSIVCWATLDESIEHLAIPPTWHKSYRHIFTSEHEVSLSVEAAELVLLTEVVVSALSADAYRVACTPELTLEDRLCSTNIVLRQGDIYTFGADQIPLNGIGHPSSSLSYRYRLDMVEPVLQGFAQKGLTKFIVILSEEDTVSPNGEDVPESECEGVEINEAFLANLSRFPVFEHYSHADMTGNTTNISGNGINDTESPLDCFRPIALSAPVHSIDDHHTLYVRTADLGTIGILNGDWVIAKPYGASSCRLVQIIANDTILSTTGTVMGCPTLLHNLFTNTSRNNRLISIRASPFGSRRPVIPNAKAITVARIASPSSLNRMYQSLFLRSLKRYFGTAKRLIKQGDVIAVAFNTDEVLYHENISEDTDQHHRPSAFPSQANELLFFCVTSVEHDVVKSDPITDVYVGELGCWVDPSATRIVQTGVEQSWVLDVGTYLDSASSNSPKALFSRASTQASSQLSGPGSVFERLVKLVSASSAQKAMDYKLDLSVLLIGARGAGKTTTVYWVAQRLGMHLLEVNCYHLLGENDVKTEGTLRARFDKAKRCSPCIVLLRHVDALAQTTQTQEPGKEPAIVNALRECIDEVQKEWKITGYPVVTLATSREPTRIPPGVISSFKHEISFQAPGEGERKEMLSCLLANCVLAADVSLSSIATQTAALVASDLADLVSRARHASLERAVRSSTAHPLHLVQAGIALTAADIELALGQSRASYSESISAPKIPNVTWDDVGGLAQVKSDILDTIQLPLEHPELFSEGLKKRSGILLYGPPGTGKTLVAKAVATSFALNFFSIKGPELLNMYIGESEANVRRVFQRARDAKPCVIFFDELDSVAPKRGNQGDSGGVMDRIVSQLLAELDGMSSQSGNGSDIFVIGATNRPDLLDPALLRPGRFDRVLYLGVSETHEAQTKILEALTRKFRLAQEVDLYEVAKQCPLNYTGADFYALCSDAMLNAMSRQAKVIDDKIAYLNEVAASSGHPTRLTPQQFLAEMASEDDLRVLVTLKDFQHALDGLIPSVSQAEMNRYAEIQRRFSQGDLRA